MATHTCHSPDVPLVSIRLPCGGLQVLAPSPCPLDSKAVTAAGVVLPTMICTLQQYCRSIGLGCLQDLDIVGALARKSYTLHVYMCVNDSCTSADVMPLLVCSHMHLAREGTWGCRQLCIPSVVQQDNRAMSAVLTSCRMSCTPYSMC